MKTFQSMHSATALGDLIEIRSFHIIWSIVSYLSFIISSRQSMKSCTPCSATAVRSAKRLTPVLHKNSKEREQSFVEQVVVNRCTSKVVVRLSMWVGLVKCCNTRCRSRCRDDLVRDAWISVCAAPCGFCFQSRVGCDWGKMSIYGQCCAVGDCAWWVVH